MNVAPYALVRHADNHYTVIDTDTKEVVYSVTGPDAADAAVCHLMNRGPVYICKADEFIVT